VGETSNEFFLGQGQSALGGQSNLDRILPLPHPTFENPPEDTDSKLPRPSVTSPVFAFSVVTHTRSSKQRRRLSNGGFGESRRSLGGVGPMEGSRVGCHLFGAERAWMTFGQLFPTI